MSTQEATKPQVYSKPHCGQCDMTKVALTKHGFEYDELQLMDNEDKLAEFKAQGIASAPVVVWPDGEIWAGFRPDRIKARAEAREAALVEAAA